MGHPALASGGNLYSGKGGEGSPAKPRKHYFLDCSSQWCLSKPPIRVGYTTRSGLFCASFRNKSSSCIALIVWIPDQLPHSRISLITQHAKQPPNLICRITLITGAPLATIWGLLIVLLNVLCESISSDSRDLDSCRTA
jgi:hypothetical protein